MPERHPEYHWQAMVRFQKNLSTADCPRAGRTKATTLAHDRFLHMPAEKSLPGPASSNVQDLVRI
jgi:hypothetical protein